jgi:threonyl-tRNA synthetase
MTEKGDEKLIELEALRHSASHIMADAVKRLFPEAKLAIGPAIEEGFYYDFDYPEGFSTEDLAKIENLMKEIISQKLPFKCEDLSKAKARKLFKERDEPYKLELIEDLEGDKVTVYSHGSFVDLCRGPHVSNTADIKAFKLLKVAGAYWRGDETKQQLSRIYGTAFPSQRELDDYLKLLEEAALRDHRKIGRDMDLFSTMEEYGAGLILWHPKGGRVRCTIEDFWREEHRRNGYDIVFTPHMARLDMWKVSGHWDFYRENMYSPMVVDDVEYEIKPMNCPFHIQIYKSRLRSYREFPMRWAELGTVYRYERSGVLHGLMRVRGFTQDDAHIFTRPDQLEAEVRRVLDFSLYMLRSFGFKEFDIFLSTKPQKHVGTDEEWDLATKALEKALKESGIRYEVDPGEGVFYGPKIDIKIKDSLGRSWQCTTIQVDFNLPNRYHMEFVGSDGEKHRPIMIHRALLGSIERFMGVLVEHYAGNFPVWLAPVQAIILTITTDQVPFAESVKNDLEKRGIRVELDDRNEKLGLKIREAEIEKVPYMLVVGKREADAKTVAVRSKGKGDLGSMAVDKFVEMIMGDIANKR